jgi:hypothetical protein
MRRLLILLAVAGLGAWLAGPALTTRPFVPPAEELALSIAAPAGGPWRSAVIVTAKRFDLVGLRWRATRRAVGARIRVRDARDGSWSAWTAMAGDEADGSGAEPVWAGGADALQLELKRAPRGLRAHFVNATGTATAGARVLTALRRGAHAAFVALAGEPARAQDALEGAPQIITREEWGAEQCGPPRGPPTYGSVQMAFVHHTVSANDYGPRDSAAIVRAICRYHRDTKHWRDIGYNFLVDRYGQIFEGREGGIDQAVIGAQAQGYNAVSTGIASIGTFTGGGQTTDAMHAMAELLAWKLTLHGVPVQGSVTVLSGGGETNRWPAGTPVTLERISGHRDADATTCPGSALHAQLPEIRRLAAEIAPELPPPVAAPATVTLTVADATLDYPQAAQLSGRVAATTGSPLAAATVSIQVASNAGFVTLSRVLTRDDGTWSTSLATQYSRSLRAVARLPDGSLATSPIVAVQVVPRISVLAPARVAATRAFTIRGSIRPLRGAVALVIARQGTDGAFHTVARVPLRTASGAFVAKIRLRRPALHRLRVESREDARNGAGRSHDAFVRAVRQRTVNATVQR